MSLKVIGTGFGRTGTNSLKLALEMLGVGPCYHMLEVFAHPEHVPVWQAVVDGRSSDFAPALGGFASTVDWPSTCFWRALVAQNPAAKVLHTERPPDEWYQSISQTIFPSLARVLPPEAPEPWPHAREWGVMVRKAILENTFGNDLSRDNALKVYRAHNDEVRATIPAERMLVFNGRDGWEPLCRFLGVKVPAEPYPRTNTTDEFRSRAGLDQKS